MRRREERRSRIQGTPSSSLFFSFFSSPSFPCERFVLPSSHYCVLRLLVFFSLSLSAVTRSGGSPSLVVDVWRWKGGGRTSRAVLFSRPVEFRRRRRRLFVSSQKLGAKRRAPLLETIGLMRKSVVDTTAPQNRAQFNRAARDARERVGTISARLSRGKWICPRESTATFEMRGRGWVVDDEASTKRHDHQSRRFLFFFPFFFIFLEKNFETFGCETFLIRPMKICVHIFVCVLS